MNQEGIRIKEVRSDAAAYKLDFMKKLDKKRVRFYFRAHNNKTLIQQAHKHEYKNAVTDKYGNEIYRYDEFKHHGYRVIVQRQRTDEKQENLLSGTLEYKYIYRMIITNDQRKKATAEFLINHYNKRGDMERNFDFLRNDFAWNKLPFSKIKENAVYMSITR